MASLDESKIFFKQKEKEKTTTTTNVDSFFFFFVFIEFFFSLFFSIKGKSETKLNIEKSFGGINFRFYF